MGLSYRLPCYFARVVNLFQKIISTINLAIVQYKCGLTTNWTIIIIGSQLIAFALSKIPILASVLPIASISNALFLINQVSLDVTYNPKRTSNPRPRVQDNALVLTSTIHSGSHHIGHGHCHGGHGGGSGGGSGASPHGGRRI